MKLPFLSFLAISFLSISITPVFGQSLVNLDWSEAFASPDTNFAWNYSEIEPSGNLITIGNTLVSGEGSNL